MELVSQASVELQAGGDHVEFAAFRDEGARGRYAYSRKGASWIAANVHRFDAVVIHGIWQHNAFAAARHARERRVPYFIYPHGSLDRALPGLYPFRHVKKLAYWELFGRPILAHAAGVCFTSANEAARATAFRGVFRSITTGAGVRPAPPRNERAIAALRAKFPKLRDSPLLLFMGRLDPIKGLDLLIRCVADVRAGRAVTLVLAGEGPPRYRRELQELAVSLRCSDSMVFTGLLTGEDKWAAFHMADLFVLTSRQESFGVAAVEALATGIPLLLTNRVGISDVVARYDAGVVCQYDPVAISAALALWLSRRDGVDAAASDRSTTCYEENFTAAAAAARLRSAIAAGSRA